MMQNFIFTVHFLTEVLHLWRLKKIFGPAPLFIVKNLRFMITPQIEMGGNWLDLEKGAVYLPK
jgi:hypothetical protein